MINTISEEKELIFDDWLRDHKTFIWAELKADMSDMLVERQLRYLINKRISIGYILKSGDEYTVIGNLEQLRREMEHDEPETNKPDLESTSKPNSNREGTTVTKENLPEEKVVEEKKPEIKKAEIKEPDLIKEKVKNIEKAQTRKRIEIKKEPKILIKKNPEEKKTFLKKYWMICAILIIGALAFLAYKLWAKPAVPDTPPPQQEPQSEFERMGFAPAEHLFQV